VAFRVLNNNHKNTLLVGRSVTCYGLFKMGARHFQCHSPKLNLGFACNNLPFTVFLKTVWGLE